MSVVDRERAIESLLRLRRLAPRVDPAFSEDLAFIGETLEEFIGPTVRPADAARLFAVSKPALKRWLDDRQIATVMTPHGRREIPIPELLDLLEEVSRARGAGSARPLGRVIRERKQRAKEAVDIERLLPRTQPRTHRTAELQALAYHRLVAERLDQPLVDEARRRLDRWRRSNRIHPRWFDEWSGVLSRPLDEIKSVISSDTAEAAELRQTSPFAGALTEQERRLLTEAVAIRAPA